MPKYESKITKLVQKHEKTWNEKFEYGFKVDDDGNTLFYFDGILYDLLNWGMSEFPSLSEEFQAEFDALNLDYDRENACCIVIYGSN